MKDEELDLRRALRILRRHRRALAVAIGVGVALGVTWGVLRPPAPEARALVLLPVAQASNLGVSLRDIGTQAEIASSDPVLTQAARHLRPSPSLGDLRHRVQITTVTNDILEVTGRGSSPQQAEAVANAVADSYVTYVNPGPTPALGAATLGGQGTHVLEHATHAVRRSTAAHCALLGVLGAVGAAVLAALLILATARRDHRLRSRDQLADALAVPVIASVSGRSPSDLPGWMALFDEHQPSAVDAWNLRRTLHELGVGDSRAGGPRTLAVVSMLGDPDAVAVGPRLASFAAAAGTRTALLVAGGAAVPASLQAACAAPPASPNLSRAVVPADLSHDVDAAALVVLVHVVDPKAPNAALQPAAAMTLLAVSAGAATAEQLARVALTAAADGDSIQGMVVVNPDPADATTGRLPQPTRTTSLLVPSRVSPAR